MTTMTQETVERVEILTKLLADSINGYDIAVQMTDEPVVIKMINNMIASRKSAQTEIVDFARKIDAEIDLDGTMMGTLHQQWMKLKDAVGLNSDEAVLTECIRGEEYLLNKYLEALQDDITYEARELFELQASRVREKMDD